MPSNISHKFVLHFIYFTTCHWWWCITTIFLSFRLQIGNTWNIMYNDERKDIDTNMFLNQIYNINIPQTRTFRYKLCKTYAPNTRFRISFNSMANKYVCSIQSITTYPHIYYTHHHLVWGALQNKRLKSYSVLPSHVLGDLTFYFRL